MHYKIQLDKNDKPNGVVRTDEGGQLWAIPFDPANTDYQQFRKDIAAGVELEDATGTVMTADQVTAFLATLP